MMLMVGSPNVNLQSGIQAERERKTHGFVRISSAGGLAAVGILCRGTVAVSLGSIMQVREGWVQVTWNIFPARIPAFSARILAKHTGV